MDAAERATVLDPDVGPYWRLLGTLYGTMRKDVLASSLAEDAFAKAVALDGKDVGARLSLARLLMGRRAWSKALDQLEQVARQDRRLLTRPITVDMCHAYVADRIAGRGEAFFREVVRAGGDSAAPKLCLAILLRAQGGRDRGKAEEGLRVADEVAGAANVDQEDAAYAKALAQDWRGGAP